MDSQAKVQEAALLDFTLHKSSCKVQSNNDNNDNNNDTFDPSPFFQGSTYRLLRSKA